VERIDFMKRIEEERERQIMKVDAREWEGDIKVWIFDVETTVQGLDNRYKMERISDFVDEVNQGRRMASDEVRRLCLDFEDQFATLQRLTKKAALAAQIAESKTHVDGVRGASKVEEYVHGKDPTHEGS
jgi:hypothetical protein